MPMRFTHPPATCQEKLEAWLIFLLSALGTNPIGI